jgi:hypothetical protein
MSRAVVLVLAVAALACDDVPDCASPCEPGQTCYYGVCIPVADGGVETDVRPDVPLDVPPDTPPDNPPDDAACTAPPGSHDEDGDTVADICDNCPEVPNPDLRDGDGDGVGDACEHPLGQEIVSDRIEYKTFEESAGWVSEGGDWYRSDGVLGQRLDNGPAVAFDRSWRGGDDVLIRTTLTFGDTRDTVYSLAGVLMRVETIAMGGTTNWYYCCLNRLDGTIQLWRSLDGTPELLAQADTGIALATGVPYRLAGSAFGTSLTCTLEGDGAPIARVSNTIAGASFSGVVGVRTYSAAARFHYVTIYR